ncbi:regulator [Salmonella enterica subsp. enterica serovar Namur str. 05-2929]|uniref:Transcriptional regulator n=5 Tax=Salmonella enterica TaxID=28901 RepID=A0A3V2D9H7_SALET|nr:helix-turn-helix transcriptional regulator [Salmonella enterica]EAA7109232.1 transcriptional regulator [Salmonella enterica subsp. enterica serovar Ouagadougou]EAB7347853.1 transcriptional regulator [Salmonella enterica subsp. enterica serovar Epalinges]EAB8411576.1 transcriptional regulator [Salmonella enterica subsp. enterica]EBX8628413.1 transcriptional regulator [Salmonella enterica subsp. enterica serovar Kintambo]EBY7291880.1 transcriptional regulator [Salmonella enterica subsp. enter
MNTPRNDWHPADIIAALRKKKTSLAAQSRIAGLSSSTLANALTRPWPRGEKLIADALGISPEIIWPSRYFDDEGHRIERVMRNR